MKPYWVKTNRFVKWVFRRFVWDMPNNDKKVYLTFDDGPTPGITEWVLDVLAQHNIKAVFFCIGNNIEKHPELFRKIIEEGHTIGNHTFNHLNGWKTRNEMYLDNVDECTKAVSKYYSQEVNLFRPPYGKIKRAQANEVKRRGYRIIMWDVLSADFDRTIMPEQCLQNVIRNTREGSIIIFHDSIKAFPNLEYALPKTIDFLKNKGYSFEAIR